MPDIVLTAETNRPTGTASARRMRHHGKVPAVVYGHGIESTPIAVDARSLRSALSTPAGANVVLELEIDGTHHLAMPKVVTHHPVRHTISHVDFIVVNRNEVVTADVPLVVVGEAVEVIRDGGAVEQVLHSISLTMLPGAIPDGIEVDVSALEPGGAVRVSDLTLPAGVSTDIDPDTAVITATRSAAVEEAPAEGEADAAAGGGEAPAEASSGDA